MLMVASTDLYVSSDAKLISRGPTLDSEKRLIEVFSLSRSSKPNEATGCAACVRGVRVDVALSLPSGAATAVASSGSFSTIICTRAASPYLVVACIVQ